MQRNPSFTKRGPGRSHRRGPTGRSRPAGRGFKGATLSVVRPPARGIGEDLAAWDRLETKRMRAALDALNTYDREQAR